jgi:hypothetical protein
LVVGLLAADPDATLAKARENLAGPLAVHRRDSTAPHWLDQWRDLLDRGIDEVAEVLTSRDPHAVELRQNTRC